MEKANTHIAITAASSFTGLWIANHFARAGYKASALFTESPGLYWGLRKLRLNRIDKRVNKHYRIKADDGSMAKWIVNHRPDIWIHHHHFMRDFRSPNYDIQKSFLVGIAPLAEIISSLSSSGCQGVIYSGTYFEPNEFAVKGKSKSSPYAISKAQVWSELEKECFKLNLPLGKIVIPNPIGPLENHDRLVPGLIRAAYSQATFLLNAKDNEADNVPVDEIARFYETLARKILAGSYSDLVLRPSCGPMTNQSLITHALMPLLKRGLSLELPPIEFLSTAGPAVKIQERSLDPIKPDWNDFWLNYAREIKFKDYFTSLK